MIFWQDSSFWPEEVDFIKTLGYNCLRTFRRENICLHLNRVSNTGLDFWRDSSFSQAKVDFIKTPGYKCLSTFWREKICSHVYRDPNTRVDFLEGFIFLVGKSRLHQNTGIWISIDFLVGKRTFALIQGSKHKVVFGEKKHVTPNTVVTIRESTFRRKRVECIKSPGYKCLSIFGGKKYVFTYTGLETRKLIFLR